ncbi:helix-turn-helix domain-containing protein [Arthrobacter sp. 1P04PC]|uniref:helix-turn-helix domain-containing protein n=1 Tax=unclassified Arthrobacter TaxID=235627 RepID=UPI00399F00F3
MSQIAYTYEQAAQQTGYSIRTIKQAVYDGHLLARYANTKAVIRHADLDAWLDQLPAEPPSK